MQPQVVRARVECLRAVPLGGMSMFTNFPEREMGNFVVISLTIITISNIVAARIVGGGDRYMFYFYAALSCTLTAISSS